MLGLATGLSYGLYTQSKTKFDVDRFVNDLWMFASPRIPPQQKLGWISYIWRFYDLEDVLCRGYSQSNLIL